MAINFSNTSLCRSSPLVSSQEECCGLNLGVDCSTVNEFLHQNCVKKVTINCRNIHQTKEGAILYHAVPDAVRTLTRALHDPLETDAFFRNGPEHSRGPDADVAPAKILHRNMVICLAAAGSQDTRNLDDSLPRLILSNNWESLVALCDCAQGVDYCDSAAEIRCALDSGEHADECNVTVSPHSRAENCSATFSRRDPVSGTRFSGLSFVRSETARSKSWKLSRITVGGSVAVSNYTLEKCKIPSSVGWGWEWGWHRSRRPAGTRIRFSPWRRSQLSSFRRKRIQPQRVLGASATSAAAPESPLDVHVDEDEERPFTSIPAGAPEEASRGSSRNIRKNAEEHFRGIETASSVLFREKSGERSSSSDENKESKDKPGVFNGRRQQAHSSKEAGNKSVTENASKGKRYNNSQVLWVKKAQTVVPRRQPKVDPGLLQAMQPGTGIDEVVQALERTVNSKGVANVMGKFASKLTIQDLKLLLTVLGTGPQRNWAKALQVFDWMYDMAVYEIDASMYHSMLVLLGKCKQMDSAESMIERMKMDGLEPDNYIFTALVGGYVRSGDIQKGIAVIEQMKAEGLTPPVPAYNVLIDGCVKLPKGLEVAKSLMKQMQQDGVIPDRVTYTTMIIVYSRKGHHTEAIRMFKEMQNENCHPDVLTCNAVLNAYAKLGDVPGMLQVYWSMVEEQVDPDTITFNILLNALGRGGFTKEVSRFYQLMQKAGVVPDVTTCSILINAYGKARAWEELDLLIAEMEALGLQPDLAVYNSLISIYGKAGRFEQVELIVKSLQNLNGITFDVITYNTLIDVYGKSGRLGDVINWFSQMRKQKVKPDVRTFNALVHAYGRASEYEGVKDVLNLFRADGSKPDLVFYHTVLFMFAKGAKYADAWGVIKDMGQEGYTLTIDIYNSLILVFGRGSAEEAVKLYSHMITSKVRPNTTTFKVLIEVFARKGLVDQCLKIFRKSREILREDSNDSLLNAVVGACCNTRRMEEAEAVLQLVDGQPGVPSVSSFNWMILGYGRQGMWRDAEKILERMSVKGLLPNGQSYSFLLEAYSLCGLFDKAEELRAKMEEHGLLSSVSACNALLRLHVRSGRPDLAVGVMEDLRSRGIKVNHNTYAALISGYGTADATLNKKILNYSMEANNLSIDQRHGIYAALLAAMPKCKTYREASSFLNVLRRLDCPSEIYSILTDSINDDHQEDATWVQLATKLHFIDMNGFNLETQRTLQNAIIDALWWLGWEVRAMRVVRMSLELGVLGEVFKWSKHEWTLNLSGGSVGAVQILLLMWFTALRHAISEDKIPPRIRIVLAEEWQLLLGENKAAVEAVQAQLNDLGVVFSRTKDRTALRIPSTELSSWLRQDHLDEKLVLVDSGSKV